MIVSRFFQDHNSLTNRSDSDKAARCDRFRIFYIPTAFKIFFKNNFSEYESTSNFLLLFVVSWENVWEFGVAILKAHNI